MIAVPHMVSGFAGSATRYISIALLALLALVFPAAATAALVTTGCNDAPFSNVISHNLTFSYCELCGTGQVSILVANPSNEVLENLSITENLGASGLTRVAGTTTYSVNGGAFNAGGDPAVSGANGEVLTWTAAQIPALTSIADWHNDVNPQPRIEIRFQVRRNTTLFNEEGLVTASRLISATVNYSLNSCPAPGPYTASTGANTLPLREPVPVLSKLGRNADAAQGNYTGTVYGNINDDVIWRVRIHNNGNAALQDLKFNDLMTAGNFAIAYACPTEGAATALAANNGVLPGGSPCVPATNTIANFAVDDPFGTPGNDQPASFVDASIGGDADIFLVGKITNSCNPNTTNTASGVEWGCEADAPDGGITATSTGATPGTATTTLSSRVNNNGLNIARALTGTNLGQPVGSKGTMTITITNNSGGTVKNIRLRDVLPAQYVVDSTYTPTLTVNPAYGNYPGMIDRINWINPVAGTYPLTSTNPADPLGNTAPEFTLTSSTDHPIYADQFNMLRAGDVAVIQFRVVMIRPTYFDLVADLDVRTENTGDGTDPTNATTLSNQLYVEFEQFCTPGVIQHPASFPYNDNFASNPEDLDVDITGTELVFILTNDPTQILPLQVSVTNHGGHDAADYVTYVTFGATMDVVNTPAGCVLTTNPPPLAVWRTPAMIPTNATVYACTGTAIAPGATRTLDFGVIKTSDPAGLAADDLTFRADLVGQITLSNGTPLWFPTPNTTVINNTSNNYSLDAIRARVVGFNLTKTQLGNCTENNPPPGSPDRLIQIGEECSFRIRSGGWFGFLTPGFTYIAVQNIQVVDELPGTSTAGAGQGYISSSVNSDPAILGITLNPPPAPLDQDWFDWTFNTVVPTQRITVLDQWFQADVTTRLMNNPQNASAAPNVHAALSTNTLNAYFEAVFESGGVEQVFNLGPNTIGYPQALARHVDLTVTEPNITVTKEVCNETLNVVGIGCGNFVTLANDGDTFDSYIYRVTLTNVAASNGVAHAPAYDISTRDILDPSGLVRIVDFASDGLDNDGDGDIDGADTDGEGSISNNNTPGVSAQIDNSYNNSSALLRINAGSSVTFYYRVDPDQEVAPLQTLVNNVTAYYDSLEGADIKPSGNQTVVSSASGDPGGARLYTSAPGAARVQIKPLATQPKIVLATSNTPLSASQPQPVSIGEEVRYELRAFLPIAKLRNFVIEDQLPPGISCIQAPNINLTTDADYSAAGFSPGGPPISITCNATSVRWEFGDQELTNNPSPTPGSRFPFPVRFIARVNNIATNNNGGLISNGGNATTATVSYQDEAIPANTVTHAFGQNNLIVREPLIALTKTMEAANADASDILTVTVTATNTGTATAYNLRVFDDLAAVAHLTYMAGSVGGTDPPDTVDTTTYGPNRPLFIWNSSHSIAPGATRSFTFEIRVDTPVQPLEVLDNTILADWTSLPSSSTALNSSGSIGVNGAADGMRNGDLSNPVADPVNDYETQASAAATVRPVAVTKTDLSPAQPPEIGSHRHFRLVLSLPEGVSNAVLVSDNLATTGLSYLLARDANFDVSYSFSGIASINGAAPAEAVFNAYPANNATGTIVWNIGTVITQNEDDTTGTPAITPTITIDYYARIDNNASTDAGDTLRNGVTVNYTNGENSGVTEAVTASTPLITVTEPNLTISKAVTLITAAPITGGDILEYRITVANTGNATAWDSNIVDTLPAVMNYYSAFTPTATVNGTAVAGFTTVPLGAPGGPLHWGSSNGGDNSLDIPAGGTLVLTYRVQILTAEPGAILTNQVWIDWTSLNDASGYERTGAGCPTITAPNDYCAGPASASVTIADTTSLVKSIDSDTWNVAPSTATDAIVRVGDTVTYRLALNVQEGLTRNVTVQDVLPGGLQFVDVVSINGDTIASYSAPGSGAGSNFSYAPITVVPAAGQTGTLTWDLGDITNNPQGDTSTDTLVIIYRARVVENVLAHTPTLTLTNTATLGYVDVNGSAVIAPARLVSSATLTVRQPVMAGLSKTDRSGRVSIAAVSPGFDIMNFRLGSCNNTGQAPAYSVQLTDTLATQFNEASIAGPVGGLGHPDVYIGGALQTTVVDYTYTLSGGDMVFNLNKPVNPGECVYIDYDIGFDSLPVPDQIWYNSVILDGYWSLPPSSGQHYPASSPVTFGMANPVENIPPSKTLVSPLTGEATVGDEIVYRIEVPRTPTTVGLHQVVVTDNLNPALVYVSATATDLGGNNLNPTVNTTVPGTVSIGIDSIPATQQAIIELHVRVDNNASANAGTTFDNTASYGYPLTLGGPLVNGGSDAAGSPIRIVEPLGTLTKTVSNLTHAGLPDAGDVLHYTLTYTAQGGANFSNAYDLALNDALSLGLLYNGNLTVSGTGNTIAAPVTAGDGVSVPQTLSWSVAQSNATINVPEGTAITIGYDVLVLDGVQANQALSNSAVMRWTGQPGANANERTGSATPAVNDYFTAPAVATQTVPDANTVTKTRLTDTYGAGDANVRIGDIVEYELRMHIQEGSSPNAVISDVLPEGLAFAELVSVNSDTAAPYTSAGPFTHAAIAAPTVTGDPLAGPSTVTWTVGDLVNDGDNDTGNDDFVIVYRAVVRNLALPQVASTALNNTATLSYGSATGPESQSDNLGVTLQQPVLTVAKSAVTGGGDTVLVPNELVTYTVDIANTGASPAYDAVLVDTIPAGLRTGGITMVSTSLVVAGTVLPNLTPVYVPATGVATWNFDTGAASPYNIPAGDTLRVVYQVQADAGLGAGLTMTNSAYVNRYYSFDNNATPTLGITTGVQEIYGPTATATVTLTTAAPGALAKQNPATTNVAVGDTFSYRITVPTIPAANALHDVRILDDLGASAADLGFVSVTRVSGTQPWTPVNTGTATNLVIEDITNGIDIPAGEQVVIDVTVRVLDTSTNVSGLTFTNTASYTYNAFNGTPASQLAGAGATTPNMTIVGPDSVTLEKSGPATLAAATAGTFTLNVHNTGTGSAWDLTIVDQLPDVAAGGMCAAAPVITSAQIYDSLGNPVLPVLTAGVDYVTAFAAAPSCTLTITTRSAAAAIGANQRLVVTYTAQLDSDTAYATTLTNIAGATQWFSADTAGAGATTGQHTYTGTITDGTVGTLDHQDAWTVSSQTPSLSFSETVMNVTTATNPAATATPGDLLRYTITLQNLGGLPITDFNLVSELDALNGALRFQPGSLTLVTVPTGANVANTNAAGGTYGSGLLDVRALNLAAGDSLTLVFEAHLAAVLDNATLVQTQTRLVDNGVTIGLSDDPALPGTEDPTQIAITSSPAFEVWKTSADRTGDPAVLAPGDTLRYTITVKNTGTENATGATLRDLVPANTAYVANSTTLNGAAVTDPGAGISPLETGMLIHAPEDPTPGAMRADANAAVTGNVATVTFDVIVSSSVVNGTAISNQGFVNGNGAASGAFSEEPSDDPATVVINDPTRDVVGSLPLVDATKTVTIAVDGGSVGIVDPGDTLRYTITVSNFGAVAATAASFTDAVPANTTYVANSTTLNGTAVADAGVGVSPLIGGIAISSSDLTPPLPAPGAGTLTAGQSATIVFDVTVNGGATPGTVISNQGTVNSTEQAPEPTDVDGNDGNGDQPTQVVVGSVQQLAISKSVTVVGGGAAIAGADLEYTIVVTNIGSLPATNVHITDNLDLPVAGQLTYVAGSGTLEGGTVGVSYSAPTVLANYSGPFGNLAPGASTTLRFRATINPALAIGTTITNIAVVDWNAGSQNASASASIDVGGIPGVASLRGQAWHDANFDLAAGGSEAPLAGWSVETYRNGSLIGTVLTDASGLYQISGLAPNTASTDQYELRFRAPGHSATTALLGYANSPFTNGLQTISALVVGSGSVTQNLNLPIAPNGAVYDSMQRLPITGATLTLLDATSQTALPAGCFDDPAQQGQVTLAGGRYRFDINFSNGACPAGGSYLINVAPPASGFTANVSAIITPQSSAATAAFSVPACLGSANDAVPGTPNHCEAVDFETPPPMSLAAGSAGTRYQLHLLLNNTLLPGHSQIFNNHIPLDPDLSESVAITKTAARVTVSRGEMVPYTITVNNNYVLMLNNQSIVDTFPPGFKYVAGSARYDGVPLEPVANGVTLRWDNIDLASSTRHTLQLLFIVGSGVSTGDYVNRAQIHNNVTGLVSSGVATATVRVVPDPTFDCSDVIGKVFDDKNLNGYQDKGEPGLPNARVVSARGLIVKSDEHGRFHITCAATPDESRGANYILKLDERSLPGGYRVTTENPRVQRLTRGKMMKFNFGAAIHHVVRLDTADGAFKPGSTELRDQWKPRIDLLLNELKKAPSLLRITYLGDAEDDDLVDERLAALKALIKEYWDGYPLTIESEIHWRRGGPADRPSLLD
ncbi:MAG: isopeptide-forming domain-containing fimbrial protein [Sideroxyarcus sp.]|nr:isopeptide-forming domain-containing fimbrial protein [Sideroxyarcus sp.]